MPVVVPLPPLQLGKPFGFQCHYPSDLRLSFPTLLSHSCSLYSSTVAAGQSFCFRCRFPPVFCSWCFYHEPIVGRGRVVGICKMMMAHLVFSCGLAISVIKVAVLFWNATPMDDACWFIYRWTKGIGRATKATKVPTQKSYQLLNSSWMHNRRHRRI